MRTFTDSSGREWTLHVSFATLKAVRDALRFDVSDVAALLGLGATDLLMLVQVLWVVVEEQAAQTGITEEQFGQSMAGQPIEDALFALAEAAADFRPKRNRDALHQLIIKQREVNARMIEKADRLMADPAYVDRVVSAATRQLDEMFSVLPAIAEVMRTIESDLTAE